MERVRGAPASLLGNSWPLLARPERPQIGFGASFGRPKAVPSASGRVPDRSGHGRTKRPKIDFSLIWGVALGWILWIFERFFVDFRSSRVRRRHESRISKRSRVVLGASLGSCVGQSLCTARTSFEITFERCVFSFFDCVPQRIPCFSANPETATFRIHVRCLLLRLLPFITSRF